jgi:succinoglycan biosynthesis transport protein ExoP
MSIRPSTFRREEWLLLSPDKVLASRHMWDDEDNRERTVDIDKLLAISRRQWRIVAQCIAVSVILGLIYILSAVPLYTATASLLIDQGNNGLLNKLTMEDLNADGEASILSQVEVLKSDTIGIAVVDSLKLADSPVFMPESHSFSSRFRGLLSRWIGNANDRTGSAGGHIV